MNWHIHESEIILEKETHKTHLEFDIRTDYLMPAKIPDLLIVNKKKKKKTERIIDFDHRVKIKDLPENLKSYRT